MQAREALAMTHQQQGPPAMGAQAGIQQQASAAAGSHEQGQAQAPPPQLQPPMDVQLVQAMEGAVLALVLRVLPWYTAQQFAQVCSQGQGLAWMAACCCISILVLMSSRSLSLLADAS
jgi:hypothetical protein